MKVKKIVGILCLSTLLICNLTGCSKDFSFSSLVFGDGSDEILSPMTNNEWATKTKRDVTALVTTGEGLLSGSKYVLNGTTPYSDEIVDVEYAIEEAENIYESLELMYEPEVHIDNKKQTLQAITSYKNACVSYKQALESKDNDLIEKAVSQLSSTIADLVLYSGDFNK